MKSAYIKDEEDLEPPSGKNTGSDLIPEPTLSHSSSQNTSNRSDDDHNPLLADAESRALVPALEVPLDDIESMDVEGDVSQSVVNVTDSIEEKNNKKAKKKARDEREREIRAAEERLLEKDIPRSADEFEKLVRISPNSSFIWIKYMALCSRWQILRRHDLLQPYMDSEIWALLHADGEVEVDQLDHARV